MGVFWLVGRRVILSVDKKGGSRKEDHTAAISIDAFVVSVLVVFSMEG